MVKDSYDDGVCPDCGWSIPNDCQDSEECINCYWRSKNGSE